MLTSGAEARPGAIHDDWSAHAMRSFHRLLPVGLALVTTAGLAQTCPPGNPLVTPMTRFVVTTPVAGQTVVTDQVTGLVWKPCSEGQSGATCMGPAAQDDWQGALARANDATHAGFDDWRLPNREELLSIIETGCFNPAINTTAFPSTEAQTYWSSTTEAANPIAAWVVNFDTGAVGIISKTDIFRRVRLVRGGRSPDAFDSGNVVFRDGYE
jgi:hypothetical protein